MTGFTVNGQLNDEPNNAPVTAFGRCDQGRFEVVNPGSVPVPLICGENSGEHSMYALHMHAIIHPSPQRLLPLVDVAFILDSFYLMPSLHNCDFLSYFEYTSHR